MRIESYLDIDEVVAAAVAAGADAVHPGYGFLSERAAFARAVEEAGLTLVGPTADVMEQMGRKDAAREIAVEAGVPVVPSYDGRRRPGRPSTSRCWSRPPPAAAARACGSCASAGEYAAALAAAQREAASAFGDDTMLVEKYVEHGRHIEVQVLADDHGNVRAPLRARLLDPAPPPEGPRGGAGADHLRRPCGARSPTAAVALAAHVGYRNAGTVEFLLDDATGEAYFLEMNTRLQVEHPVTEPWSSHSRARHRAAASTWSSSSCGWPRASRCRSARTT